MSNYSERSSYWEAVQSLCYYRHPMLPTDTRRCNTIIRADHAMPTVTLSVTIKLSSRHFGIWALACIKFSLVNILGAFSFFFPHVWCYCWTPRFPLLGSLSQAVNSDPALLKLLYSAQSEWVMLVIGLAESFLGWLATLLPPQQTRNFQPYKCCWLTWL